MDWIIGDALSGGGSGSLKSARAGRASRAGARAGRIVRLVRMVKLYKYFKTNESKKAKDETVAVVDSSTPAALFDAQDLNIGGDENGNEGENIGLNDQSETEAEPESRVGAAISDLTTRRYLCIT